MTVHRPGDVLAGRYRLADLLSETEHGRFWLAHDSILGRPVAVHVIDADDPRAPHLMEAARASASIADQRLLRVLDAETREGISYVVNEWGRGSSLDVVLARSGPLPPDHAAWITAQVAGALAKSHSLGFVHGRLIPENVLIDEAGGVRIIGFAVEAVLYGLSTPSAAEDDAALAALLVACLTGTWPGRIESAVPATPLDGSHPMRPRQVRAGVPRVLDDLCDAALNPGGRGRHSLADIDAHYLHDRLLEFVGAPPDLTDLPEEHGPLRSDTGALSTIPYPDQPRPAGTAPSPAIHLPVEPGTDLVTGEQTRVAPLAPSARDEADRADEGEATQHGIPSFEDDDSWHRPSGLPSPPPPPLEAPEPKPLFADEPRTPRASDVAPSTGGIGIGDPTRTAAVPPGAHGQDPISHWPWVDDAPRTGAHSTVTPEPEGPPPSRWLPFAVGFVVILLVIAVALIVHQATSGGPARDTPTDGATQEATPRPITGLSATDFDPFASPQEENPEQAKYAVDGKPGTAWQTNTYTDQLGEDLPALKSGVGLVIDLKRTYAISTATITVDGGPTEVSFYVTDDRPTTPNGLKAAARATITSPEQRVAMHDARGRYLVVWLTSLPPTTGGYRGSVAEVALTGTRVG